MTVRHAATRETQKPALNNLRHLDTLYCYRCFCNECFCNQGAQHAMQEVLVSWREEIDKQQTERQIEINGCRGCTARSVLHYFCFEYCTPKQEAAAEPSYASRLLCSGTRRQAIAANKTNQNTLPHPAPSEARCQQRWASTDTRDQICIGSLK